MWLDFWHAGMGSCRRMHAWVNREEGGSASCATTTTRCLSAVHVDRHMATHLVVPLQGVVVGGGKAVEEHAVDGLRLEMSGGSKTGCDSGPDLVLLCCLQE